MSDNYKNGTIFIESDEDFLDELSEYLDVLSNPARLKILKSIEKKPADLRDISYEIGISYENTKKHIQKLHLAGVIKKETGISSRKTKGVHPVWKYSIMPGGLEAVFKNLQIFSDVNLIPDDKVLSDRIRVLKSRLSNEITGKKPVLFIIGGPLDGNAYILTKSKIRIGRSDTESTYIPEDGDIVFPDFYGAVSRITKPHCTIYDEGEEWYIEDLKSTGGTYINGNAIEKEIRHKIYDGDTIELSRGTKAGKLLFSYTDNSK
ncbi:MAG: FHA domain-containing protein [Methanomicrobiaceae archaeon]|nr:FHA domain-containing protein [Methanomicrobiaceae archaeon]